jgi:hypothetical protein
VDNLVPGYRPIIQHRGINRRCFFQGQPRPDPPRAVAGSSQPSQPRAFGHFSEQANRIASRPGQASRFNAQSRSCFIAGSAHVEVDVHTCLCSGPMTALFEFSRLQLWSYPCPECQFLRLTAPTRHLLHPTQYRGGQAMQKARGLHGGAPSSNGSMLHSGINCISVLELARDVPIQTMKQN